jgi:hypothetical protein
MKNIYKYFAYLAFFGNLSLFADDLQSVDVQLLQLEKSVDGVYLVRTNDGAGFFVSPIKVDFLSLPGKTLDDSWRKFLPRQLIWQFSPSAKRTDKGFIPWGYALASGQWAFVDGTHLVLARFEIKVSVPKYDGVTNRVLEVHCESFSSELEKGFSDDIARALQETRAAQKQLKPTER